MTELSVFFLCEPINLLRYSVFYLKRFDCASCFGIPGLLGPLGQVGICKNVEIRSPVLTKFGSWITWVKVSRYTARSGV